MTAIDPTREDAGSDRPGGTVPVADSGFRPSRWNSAVSRRPRSSVLARAGFLVPAVVLVGVFALVPAVATIWRSFFDDRFTNPAFVWFGSYAQVLGDPAILRSLLNTVIWLVGTVIIPGGLGLAIAAMTNATRWGRYARLAVVLPYALSGSAVAIVWNAMLQNDGAINTALSAFGLHGAGWLLSWPLDTVSLIVANSWQATGVAVILYLVGLQGVPRETIEAAALDGVSGMRRFFAIVFPQMRATTAVVLGISLANGLKSFDLIWVLTQGGPGRQTETLAVSMYWQSFVLQRPGTGAAIAVILSVIVVGVSITYLRRQLSDR
ncbi:sugar ABC transporter permease [Curtobacterium sp. MCBD17_003]|uniref:carbohydrate ABC transporter permease n=1 Tax=Curtobacterium sp. MCBD17_003 TaxID=2175667 RepID=UPI000DA7A531|nr:sugar ABC transporter permease [Curtobacterium sp. MCBD17_003]WIE54006.1 sugar ABC transporter permease [Curtobacterium sp. MCBD17_003]